MCNPHHQVHTIKSVIFRFTFFNFSFNFLLFTPVVHDPCGNAQRKHKQQAHFQIDAILESVGKEQQQGISSFALSETEKDTTSHANVSLTYKVIAVNLLIEYLVRLKNKKKCNIMCQHISDIFAEHLYDEAIYETVM